MKKNNDRQLKLNALRGLLFFVVLLLAITFFSVFGMADKQWPATRAIVFVVLFIPPSTEILDSHILKMQK